MGPHYVVFPSVDVTGVGLAWLNASVRVPLWFLGLSAGLRG